MNSTAEFETIAQLDLDPIKVKLMHKESGEGWSLDYANTIEGEYRRFLCLMKLFPNEPMAPLFDVDIFWHYHILDTMKYAADCELIFGYFLHHFPYLGLRGEDDEAAHYRVGARTKELYEATFGAGGQCNEDTHPSAKTAWSMTGARADGTQRFGASAKSAWSMTGAATDRPHSIIPAGATNTAWSMTGAQGGDVYELRPTMGNAIGARWMQQAQNDSGDSSGPVSRAAITAWSMTPARAGTRDGARPALGKAATAWSMTPAQNRGPTLPRPMLEIAA